jgi:hypothetical protein
VPKSLLLVGIDELTTCVQSTVMSLGLVLFLLHGLLLSLLNFLVACGAVRALRASTAEESCLPKTHDTRIAHSVAARQLPRITIVLIELLVADAAVHERNAWSLCAERKFIKTHFSNDL